MFYGRRTRNARIRKSHDTSCRSFFRRSRRQTRKASLQRAVSQHRTQDRTTGVADLDGRRAGGWSGRRPDPDVALETREAAGLEPAEYCGGVRNCCHGASAGLASVLGGLHCWSTGRLWGGSPLELIVTCCGHQTPIRSITDTHSSQMQSVIPASQPIKHISRANVPSSREGSSQRRVAPVLLVPGGTSSCDTLLLCCTIISPKQGALMGQQPACPTEAHVATFVGTNDAGGPCFWI